MENIYYVYVILNPLKSGEYVFNKYKFMHEPFYVGKGKGSRLIETLNENKNKFKVSVIKKIRKNGLKPNIIIIKDNITEKEAFNLERELISLIGRRDVGSGLLTNFTDGGEGTSGIIQSKETIEKRKRSLKKYRNYFKSDDFKEKMRESIKKRKLTPEYQIYRKKISEKYTGEGNPMFGKKTSEKQKNAVKQAHLDGRIKLTNSGREKIIETNKKRIGKKNNKIRKDVVKYKLIAPNKNNHYICGAQKLQNFCKEQKLQYHVLKNNIDVLINKNLVIGNKIYAKNTIGWKINKI